MLQGTLHHHCNRIIEKGLIHPKFVEEFLSNLYVDDSNGGVDSIGDGFQWYKKAKFLMQSGGFMLRKWCTNDEILQRMINEEERVTDMDMNYEHKSKKPLFAWCIIYDTVYILSWHGHTFYR